MHVKKGKRIKNFVGGLTRRRLWIILALALVGCATVGPDYAKVEPRTPDEWHAEIQGGLIADSRDPETLAHWWSTLNDAELDSLVSRAVNGNLDLKNAQARIREARALRGISKATLFPTLDAAASASNSAAVKTATRERKMNFILPLLTPAGNWTFLAVCVAPWKLPRRAWKPPRRTYTTFW